MAEAAAIGGTERAAILLMTLGEQAAAAILRHMDVEDVQRLGVAMAALDDVPRAKVVDVLGALLVAVDDKTPIGIGTDDYLRKVLTDSLGERKAKGVVGRILGGREAKGIDSLKWMEPKAVADLVKSEHPQIVATLLAHLGARQGADVLAELPLEQQAEVALRVARLDEIPETALQELDALVEQQTREGTPPTTARLGGLRAAADMINLLPPAMERDVLEAVKAADAVLGEQIKEALFVFDNLLALDDRGMQAILREVQSETLIVALKGADESMRDKVLRNMSKRAAALLKDDLDAKGPVRLSEVEAAQKEILGIAQRLADEGQIMLSNGEDFV